MAKKTDKENPSESPEVPASFTPPKAPKAVNANTDKHAELVAEKVAAGLPRHDAITVATAQIAHDEALEAAE